MTDGVPLECAPVTGVIPQTSALVSVLFITYINDTEVGFIRKFADDSENGNSVA